MIRLTSYSISLTFKCQFDEVVLLGPPAVARMDLMNRVCSFFCPAICPSVFSEFDHLVSLNFAMVLKILIKLCVTELDFLEKHFLPQKLGNGPKIFFLILKKIWSLISLKLFYNENLFYFLSSFTYPIFEKKSCTWDIDQNALSQADSRIFKSTISPEQIDETA